MSKVLLIAEHDGTTLNAGTAKAVACAASLPDAEIDIAIFAVDGTAVAAQAAELANVSKVLQIDHDSNKNALAAVIAPQAVIIASGYSHVFGSSSTFGRDLIRWCSSTSGWPAHETWMAHRTIDCWQ